MTKWFIAYYRPLSGPAIQADIVRADAPIPGYADLIAVEPLEGSWSLLDAAVLENGINRGLRFACSH